MTLQKETKEPESDDCESSANKVTYEVVVGNLVNETTDAIVNGVSSNFDLNWGRFIARLFE